MNLANASETIDAWHASYIRADREFQYPITRFDQLKLRFARRFSAKVQKLFWALDNPLAKGAAKVLQAADTAWTEDEALGSIFGEMSNIGDALACKGVHPDPDAKNRRAAEDKRKNTSEDRCQLGRVFAAGAASHLIMYARGNGPQGPTMPLSRGERQTVLARVQAAFDAMDEAESPSCVAAPIGRDAHG